MVKLTRCSTVTLKIEKFVEKRWNRDVLHVDGWLSWSWSKPENVILIEFLRMRTNGVTKGHKTWRYEPGLTSRNITHASDAARPQGNQFPDEKNVNFPVFMSRLSFHQSECIHGSGATKYFLSILWCQSLNNIGDQYTMKCIKSVRDFTGEFLG